MDEAGESSENRERACAPTASSRARVRTQSRGGSATGWRWESTATAHATGDITSPRVASHSHTRFPSPLISPRPSSATKSSD